MQVVGDAELLRELKERVPYRRNFWKGATVRAALTASHDGGHRGHARASLQGLVSRGCAYRGRPHERGIGLLEQRNPQRSLAVQNFPGAVLDTEQLTLVFANHRLLYAEIVVAASLVEADDHSPVPAVAKDGLDNVRALGPGDDGVDGGKKIAVT